MGHAPQVCCVAEQLTQLSQSVKRSCKGVLHAVKTATHHALQAGSQADIREAARRGLELARTATPAAPSHAVSGEQGGEMRSPRYSARESPNSCLPPPKPTPITLQHQLVRLQLQPSVPCEGSAIC